MPVLGALSAFDFGSNHLLDDGALETDFTSNDPAAHTTITLPFDLALWDSVSYGRSVYSDSTRFVSMTFAHSVNSLNLVCQYPALHGTTNESFGIDNIVISSDAVKKTGVPEPSTMALAGLASIAIPPLLLLSVWGLSFDASPHRNESDRRRPHQRARTEMAA